MKFTGTAHRYGRDVDTDVIIPARYLNTSDPAELAKHCMEDLDAGFVGKVEPGDILVAEENFGCGSSREHAPISIKAAGVSVVIAKSFARIFYRNAINTGLPIMEAPEAVDGISDGDKVEVDADAGTITNVTTGATFTAQPFPPFIKDIIEQGGLIESIKAEGRARERRRASPHLPAARRRHRPRDHRRGGQGPRGRSATRHGVAFEFDEALLGGAAIDATGTALPDETLAGGAARPTPCCSPRSAGRSGTPPTPPSRGPSRGCSASARRSGSTRTCGRSRSSTRCATPRRSSPSSSRASTCSSCASSPAGCTSARATASAASRVRARAARRACAPTTRWTTASSRSRASLGRRSRRRAPVAARCTASTRPTCSRRSRLWREVVHRVHEAEYSDVELVDQLVDNSAMQLIRWPAQFDVMVTENMFGDILSDEASMLTGSLGMLASASLGDGTALYEPSHGSAPDIAGQGIANPLAMLLSVELMLRYSFEMHEAADELAAAIEAVLDNGWRTQDIASAETLPQRIVGTSAMGDLVAERLASGVEEAGL